MDPFSEQRGLSCDAYFLVSKQPLFLVFSVHAGSFLTRLQFYLQIAFAIYWHI